MNLFCNKYEQNQNFIVARWNANNTGALRLLWSQLLLMPVQDSYLAIRLFKSLAAGGHATYEELFKLAFLMHPKHAHFHSYPETSPAIPWIFTLKKNFQACCTRTCIIVHEYDCFTRCNVGQFHMLFLCLVSVPLNINCAAFEDLQVCTVCLLSMIPIHIIISP